MVSPHSYKKPNLDTQKRQLFSPILNRCHQCKQNLHTCDSDSVCSASQCAEVGAAVKICGGKAEIFVSGRLGNLLLYEDKQGWCEANIRDDQFTFDVFLLPFSPLICFLNAWCLLHPNT